MRFEFYGLAFETPHVIFHLWSPWRATNIEHRLFEALRLLPRAELEDGPDERRLILTHYGSPSAAPPTGPAPFDCRS